MARKRNNESNGVMEADPIEVDSTDIPESVDPVATAINEHEEEFAARPEEPEPETAEVSASQPPPEPEPDPFLAKLVERQREADAIHSDYLILSERAKERKKQWEAKQEEVASLIRRSSKPMPLFDPKPSEPFEPCDEPEIDGATTILQIAPGTEAVRDGWKTTGVADLIEHGMPKKYVSILAESDVHTIGDIQALGEKRMDLTDLKGVGDSARDKIYDALDKFWAAHPEYGDQPAAVAEDATEAPADDFDEVDDEASTEFPDDPEGDGFEEEFADDEPLGDPVEDDRDFDEFEDDGPSYDEIDPERGDD